MLIKYSSNNSGGGWWLTTDDWKRLEAGGWIVDWEDEPWLGAMATQATIECDSLEDAIKSFESITGQYASEIGCTCCGPPHNFYDW